MSVVSDSGIIANIYSKELALDPLLVENIQPSSIDLTLGGEVQVPLKKKKVITPPYPSREEIEVYFKSHKLKKKGYVLKPGEFILAQIQETIKIPGKFVGNIQNRNSLIRMGIDVGLSTYINPGYEGKLPIAIKNIGEFEFELTPGMRICQLVLSETEGVMQDYSKKEDSKYHAEQDITLSRLSEDKEFVDCISANKQKNTEEIISFLKERTQKKAQEFLDQLNPQHKKALGL